MFWQLIDFEMVFLLLNNLNKENGVFRLLSKGKDLISFEKGMMVEEWIYYNVELVEQMFKMECENMVLVFEREGMRVMRVLEGLIVEQIKVVWVSEGLGCMEYCWYSNKVLFGFWVVLCLGLFSCLIKGYCVVCFRFYFIYMKNLLKEGVLEVVECLLVRSYWMLFRLNCGFFFWILLYFGV